MIRDSSNHCSKLFYQDRGTVVAISLEIAHILRGYPLVRDKPAARYQHTALGRNGRNSAKRVMRTALSSRDIYDGLHAVVEAIFLLTRGKEFSTCVKREENGAIAGRPCSSQRGAR